MTHTLLAVDPGAHDAGVAFYVAGNLADCTLLRPKPLGEAPTYDVARYVALWASRCMYNLGDPEGRVSQLIVEGQQVYPGPRREDPNALFALAQVVGGVMARVDAFEREIILPRVWTKGVPKEVRQRRFLASLNQRETALISAIKPASKAHNAIDAAMLGAYKLGRIRNDQDERFQQ